jgi:hypothetical protein
MLLLTLLLAQEMRTVDPRSFEPSVREYVAEEYRAYRLPCDLHLHSCPPEQPKSEWVKDDRLGQISSWACRDYYRDGRPTGVATCTFVDRRLVRDGRAARCTAQFEFNDVLSSWTFPLDPDSRDEPVLQTADCQLEP